MRCIFEVPNTDLYSGSRTTNCLGRSSVYVWVFVDGRLIGPEVLIFDRKAKSTENPVPQSIRL